MADETTTELPERITVLARDFTPAAMEFHRRNMSEKGYRMEGQIVQSGGAELALQLEAQGYDTLYGSRPETAQPTH